jgi:uncharacterized protein YkwD
MGKCGGRIGFSGPAPNSRIDRNARTGLIVRGLKGAYFFKLYRRSVSAFSKTLPAVFASFALLAIVPARADTRGLESQVLDEVNFARTHPAEYARFLRDYRDHQDEDVYTSEGTPAIDEAIAFMDRQQPLPPLKLDLKLSRSAGGYARDQGPEGLTGHVSADGATLSDRMHRQQVWSMFAAETISYGYENPRDVVRQLIVDDGVPGRGHREVLFNAIIRFAGVGCGPHRVYGAMCVIDFSGSMIAR